jgi:hypothetical protein
MMDPVVAVVAVSAGMLLGRWGIQDRQISENNWDVLLDFGQKPAHAVNCVGRILISPHH